MSWLSWVISALVGSTVLGWILYVVGVQQLPTGERPQIEKLNRLGRSLGKAEAPGYRIMAGESEE